jgi:hypothetical protein
MPHPARYNWRTGHPVLDGLLSVWQEYRLQSRPPRWSEIRDHIAPEVHAHLILLENQRGMRPPVCIRIGPTAAQLLGLPPNFTGAAWTDESRPHRIAPLTRTVARRKLAVRGQLTPGPDCPTILQAIGAPCAAEPDGDDVVEPAGDERTVVIVVAWPTQIAK